MTTRRPHVYTRISKTTQTEGSGLDEQTARIEQYLKDKRHLFEGDVTYWQDIGVSAYRDMNIQHGQLSEFIKQVDEGRIGQGDALIIYSLDRLSRRSSWDETTIQHLVKKGVEIHDVSTPVVLNREDSMSKIIMELIVTRGNNESKIKSERSTAGWEKRLNDTLKDGRVFTNKLPRWLGSNDDQYVVLKNEAEIIKRIFREYTNGMSSPMIARRLNEEGTGKSLWRPNTITKLIKDERLRGNLVREKITLIPNVFPKVIDDELFVLANRILSTNAVCKKGRPRENNKTREVNNIITGLVRCGKCGSKVTTTKNGRGMRYITCLNRLNYKICGQKSIRLEEVERIVITHVKQVDLSKVLSISNADTSNEALLQAELIELKIEEQSCRVKIDERKRLKQRASLPLANALTDIQDRIEEIQSEILNLQVQEPLPDISSDSISALLDASNVELRMSLRKYLVQVVDKLTFINIGDYNIIEVQYNNNVYCHALITDKKLKVLHEVDITVSGDNTTYNSGGFSIVESESEGVCTFEGIDNVSYTDYFLLANYIGSLPEKQWIVDVIYLQQNMDAVLK
ncbi:recombinase family protein [Serratia plymuthica]|uniref:recombinase family protein n=1 Tax=Serratia plymuthica TaxID=82996 RepID=UPI001BAF6E65|nr:recombinase family protein [Serratia plymuthica]QUY50333.1 recombinase family protein [Serratia plymuthica]